MGMVDVNKAGGGEPLVCMELPVKEADNFNYLPQKVRGKKILSAIAIAERANGGYLIGLYKTLDGNWISMEASDKYQAPVNEITGKIGSLAGGQSPTWVQSLIIYEE